ncbi:MAG TPA: CDP-diacylglycerol--glycerol-3-phosphate 3-phosphatidyltransferase [Thermoanaerobaculia bacterium]|nr:CDP-diacylglycerol--glycerol-3-phosphate 3-phosphatidyltransferase [Thermoanaerobaculia bacterium]
MSREAKIPQGAPGAPHLGDALRLTPRASRWNINLPNALTLLRIFLVPFLVVVLLTKFDGREIVALAIFLLATATDFFDGWLARRRGEITTLGTLLDPIADKLLISAAFISLVELNLVPAWMVVVVVGREFAVTGLRSIAAGQGILISASGWGKAKMTSQITAVSLLILSERYEWFLLPGKIALWIVVAIAIISGAQYFRLFLQRVMSFTGPAVPPE